MGNNKVRIQSLIFNKNVYSSKPSVKNWISKNGFIVDTRLRRPIIKSGDTFRVRQKNPDFFNKKTFKVESLGKGVKGVYGNLKNRR